MEFAARTPDQSKPTEIKKLDEDEPEYSARRERAARLMADIAAGVIVSPQQLDPRATSHEVVHMARLQLVALGRIARKKAAPEL